MSGTEPRAFDCHHDLETRLPVRYILPVQSVATFFDFRSQSVEFQLMLIVSRIKLTFYTI